MARKYRYNQVPPDQLGIVSPGLVLQISEIRMPIGDGTKAVFRPTGKPFFDDGDELDLDTAGIPANKLAHVERRLSKDPRFTKKP